MLLCVNEIKRIFSLDWQTHTELEWSRSTSPANTNPFRWQHVSITALSLPHKTPIHTAKRELWPLIGWFGSHDPAPGFIFPFRNFLHKAPFDCTVGRCVWSVPPLSNCRPRKMRWRDTHTQKKVEWDSDNWPYPRLAPAVSGRGRRRPGERETLLTHGEKTGGNCPSSSNYPRQIKTQDMEAYLGSVKQEKAEKGLGGWRGWRLVVGTEAWKTKREEREWCMWGGMYKRKMEEEHIPSVLLTILIHV